MTASTSGVIEGISLWDGTTHRGAATVRWTDGRIDEVRAADPTAEPATRLRASGYSLIPGLIDTHVHLDTSVVDRQGPGSAWPLVTPDSEKSLHVVGHAQRFAEFGVTTLRDLAASSVQMSASRAMDQGVIEGPRLLAYGNVGMTAGHGDLFTPPRYTVRPPVADSPDQCRALVRHWAREGAHGIKIYTSGGILSMGDKVEWRNQTRAEIAATIDEAHALGLKVAAHSHTAEGILIALDEGVDSIEHGTGMRPEHFARLLENNVPISPTLLINDLIAQGSPLVDDEAHHKAAAVIGERDPIFRQAGPAGIRFVLGTDANAKFVPYGGQLLELQKMADLFGWSSERTLVSATSDAADSIGMGDSLGTIADGYLADMVVVKGEPWERIGELTADAVVAVISRGRVISGSLPV